jgi:hypothetical protein
MRVIEFNLGRANPIELYESAGAAGVTLGDGAGETHVHWLHFEAGGAIGEHRAGFGQLFLVVSGEGWATGGDGVRRSLAAGQGAFFERGEKHSKGTDTGMTVIMVQTHDLHPHAPQTSSPQRGSTP